MYILTCVHVYIYICTCVCVCVWPQGKEESLEREIAQWRVRHREGHPVSGRGYCREREL